MTEEGEDRERGMAEAKERETEQASRMPRKGGRGGDRKKRTANEGDGDKQTRDGGSGAARGGRDGGCLMRACVRARARARWCAFNLLRDTEVGRWESGPRLLGGR